MQHPSVKPRRSLDQAHIILRAAGASDWIGASEDQLGVSQEEHEAWLCSAPATEVHDWAQSVATDHLPAESLNRFALSSPLFGDGGLE